MVPSWRKLSGGYLALNKGYFLCGLKTTQFEHLFYYTPTSDHYDVEILDMSYQPLLELLSCPINWEVVCPEPEMAEWLYFGWYATCHRYQVDREVSFNFSYENFKVSEGKVAALDDTEIAVALHNVKKWIEEARSDYLSFFRRFALITAVGAETYSKHYSAQAISSSTVANKSAKRGASVLLPYITTVLQERLMWAALDNLTFCEMENFHRLENHHEPRDAEAKFRSLYGDHSVIVAVDYCYPMGATKGEITSLACIDLDFSTPQFHIYPISRSEYDSTALRSYVQGWNYELLPIKS